MSMMRQQTVDSQADSTSDTRHHKVSLSSKTVLTLKFVTKEILINIVYTFKYRARISIANYSQHGSLRNVIEREKCSDFRMTIF
jgi:hypothetical protein